MCGNGTDYNLIALGLKNIFQMEKQLTKSVHQWQHYLDDIGEEGLSDELREVFNKLNENNLALDDIIEKLLEQCEANHHHHHEHYHDHEHSHATGQHEHSHEQSNDCGVDITMVSGKNEK